MKNIANRSNTEGLRLSGTHKKLKTMKKKYFVLYEKTNCKPARLEYYDSKRKFQSDYSPKRVIELSQCFNIVRKSDQKHENIIALSTKDGGFGIVFEKAEELTKWMNEMTSLAFSEVDSFHPHFDNVWQVDIQRKGLAEKKDIIGNYHVCLTSKSITLIRIGSETTNQGEKRLQRIEFLLTTIRRCGDSQCVFYMEVGRQSVIGPGELWMATEDACTAQDMHHTILKVMTLSGESNVIEPMRKRSSSATEASKPINVSYRKSNQLDNKVISDSPQSTTFERGRCDSLPTRNRTLSECSNHNNYSISMRTAIATNYHQRHSSSPPMNSLVGCSESEESVSIDGHDDIGGGVGCLNIRHNSCNAKGIIIEENIDDLSISEAKSNGEINRFGSDIPSRNEDIVNQAYTCMAPLQSPKDSSDAHRLMKPLHSPVSYNYGSLKSERNVAKHSTEEIRKQLPRDNDLQLFMRPTRAYSTGSKFEHNQFVKRIAAGGVGAALGAVNNMNDLDFGASSRVRAYSVGSRSTKISSRPDLQRGAILGSMASTERAFNANNNFPFNDILSVNCAREKKSTSAPLLIHKSLNSVDRMSDLMEIDFSKTAHNTGSGGSSAAYYTDRGANSKNLYSKSMPNAGRDLMNLAKSERYEQNEDFLRNRLTTTATTAISTSGTDNGYLEMKPVGNSLPKSTANNQANLKAALITATVPESLSKAEEEKESRTAKIHVQSAIQTPKIIASPVQTPKTAPINIPARKSTAEDNSRVESKISTNLSELSLDSEDNNTQHSYKADLDDYVNIGGGGLDTKPCLQLNKTPSKESSSKLQVSKFKNSCFISGGNLNNNHKLAHSISDENYKFEERNQRKQKSGSNNESSTGGGYEILQIKSDSSLQSTKLLYRPTPIKRELLQTSTNPTITPEIQLKATVSNSTMISSPSSSSSTLCGNSSGSALGVGPTSVSSNTCLNVNKELNNSNSRISGGGDSSNTSTPTPFASRPPSVCSEKRELYYASLDLPECTKKEIINPKVNLADNTVNTSLDALADASGGSNAYAKIDFENSDSSSSSKNISITNP